jgi:hypothetical protein
MVDNLPKHIYPTKDDNGDVWSPPCATQFEKLYNIVSQLLMEVDGDQTNPPTSNAQHDISSIPGVRAVPYLRVGAWTSTPRMFIYANSM